MPRARGSNAKKRIAFETEYGLTPPSGFYEVPFITSAIGDKQDLLASNLLGQGRDPADPDLGPIDNAGDIQVPVDLRNFPLWLRSAFGAPVTTAGLPASGALVFTAQPADGSSITINGTEFTFVAADPGAGDILIGATLAATLTATVYALNASADANVNVASYELNPNLKSIDIVHDTLGTSGNSFTLAVSSSPASNATPSGATLAGGAATGAYRHVFTSGGLVLGTFSDEVGLTDASVFAMNYGGGVDKIAIQAQRADLLNATLSCICQGEAPWTQSSAAGSPTVLAVERFSQFTGAIMRQGVPLANLVSGNFTTSNNLDKIEGLRGDGRILGIDPGEAAYNGQITVRFQDMIYAQYAQDGSPIDLLYRWKKSLAKSLAFQFERVFLPRKPFEISGAGGIQQSYDWQAAKKSGGAALTVTVFNDVASYA